MTDDLRAHIARLTAKAAAGRVVSQAEIVDGLRMLAEALERIRAGQAEQPRQPPGPS